jgi:hypothetical protein
MNCNKVGKGVEIVYIIHVNFNNLLKLLEMYCCPNILGAGITTGIK